MERVIGFYKVGEDVEERVREGPGGVIDNYLTVMHQVSEAMDHFHHFNPESMELEHLSDLFFYGREALFREFLHLLTKHSKPVHVAILHDIAVCEDVEGERESLHWHLSASSSPPPFLSLSFLLSLSLPPSPLSLHPPNLSLHPPNLSPSLLSLSLPLSLPTSPLFPPLSPSLPPPSLSLPPPSSPLSPPPYLPLLSPYLPPLPPSLPLPTSPFSLPPLSSLSLSFSPPLSPLLFFFSMIIIIIIL